MIAIEAAHVHRSALATGIVVLCVVSLIVFPQTASAIGQAASGELLFYPCSTCHPVASGATLPNAFEAHQIALVGHDVLGDGSAACLVCHADPAADPGLLLLTDGTTVEVGGDVSRQCFGCHSARYREWEAGAHGREQESCTSAGCHDPHTPAWIYGEPLPPFTGTGFEARVVSNREPFTPLAGPPVKAPVETPGVLVLATFVAVAVSAGLVGFLVRGRASR